MQEKPAKPTKQKKQKKEEETFFKKSEPLPLEVAGRGWVSLVPLRGRLPG